MPLKLGYGVNNDFSIDDKAHLGWVNTEGGKGTITSPKYEFFVIFFFKSEFSFSSIFSSNHATVYYQLLWNTNELV